jgi:hypothetical protein
MAGASRLTAAGGSDNFPIAPKAFPRSGDFDPGSYRRDIRKNLTQLITLADISAGDEFTLTFPGLGTTAAFTEGADMTAAAIQTALRSLTGDSALTVTGTTDTGPFTVTFSGARLTQGKPWKLMTVTGTGMSGTVTAVAQPEYLLGQSRVADAADSGAALTPPTIGTITVTEATNEVATLDYSAGTDGGTFTFEVDGRESDPIDWDATHDEAEAIIDTVFTSAGYAAADAPSVAGRGTADVQTLELNDIGNGDTFTLTHDSVATGVITFAAVASDNSALILAAIEALAAFVPGDVAVTKTDNNTYVLTFDPSLGPVDAFTITDPVGFTPTGVTDTATGAQDGFTFTFDTGQFEGQPVASDPNAISYGIGTDALTDGGVAEPAAFTVSTAGVRGGLSAAYTETATIGDSVLGVAVNTTTGATFGPVVDAATPLAFTGLEPGVYRVYLATVANKRVGRFAESIDKTIA